ncbi:restriction endonuclease subunit S [Litorilinea aerophila]|nr:restriction endonuclease subunit S [Litorilinea aerophila]
MRIPVKKADRRPGPYPYYGASGIVDYVDSYIFDGEYLLLAEDGENLRSRNLPIAFMASGKFWVNNHAHVLKGNSHNDTRFLCYALQVANVGSYLSGSTRPKLTQGDMRKILLPCPPLPEQRAIAHILGTLDDKIELNRRMNATLEAMARALFKSWFVDFDPVWENVRRKEENARAQGREDAKGEEELRALASSRLGVEKENTRAQGRKGATEDLAAAHPGAPSLPEEILALFPDAFEESALGLIPQGWRVTPILEYAERLSGGTPKTSVPEYWNGDIKWVSAKDVRNAHGSFVLDTEKKVTALGIERSSAKILPANTTVVTARGTVGSYCLLAEPMSINQTNYGLKSKLGYGDYFVFFTLANLVGWLQQNSYGTIFDTITTRTFEQSKTVFPDTTLIRRFDEEVAPFMERMKANLYESRTLAGLRDTLLPRLISGELRVEDAEQFLAEAGV